MYKMTVEVDLFDPREGKMRPHQFDGESNMSTEKAAIEELKEWYAVEFGTDPEEIRILKIVEI